jgi:predicted DNA-binding transcriptional regulator YafY
MQRDSLSELASPADPGPRIIGFWRIYEINRLVAERTYPNCESLSDHLEVHRRTVERDIGRLRDLFGAPLEYDPSRRGYYYAGPFDLPAMRLREGEAIALFLGQRLLMQCRGTPYESAVRQVLAKIRTLLPREVEVSTERALKTVSFHVDPLRGEELELVERYRVLLKAAEEQVTVEMDYYSPARETVTHRRMDPYHLRFVDGAWYCIGFCHERKEVRTFALDRIVELGLTGEKSRRLADFSLDDYFSSSWVLERGEPTKVVIEFDPEQAKYVRGRQWHQSQQCEEQPGGSLRMTLVIGSLGEIMRWVMSFGSHARVLEPPDLRERVEMELAAALRSYRNEARSS